MEMYTILDYLKWRGDITFEEKEINNIDCLIMSIISYFPFEKVINDSSEILTIAELYARMVNVGIKSTEFLLLDDAKLFRILATCERYKDLILSDFVCSTNLEKEKQFAALVIHLPNNSIYVSYRGTDSTFVGWKEDFNMTYLDEIPSQISAVGYLDRVKVKMFTKVYVGGHSKGGNLAVYASLHCRNRIKNKIKKIFNYDGPGFLKDITNSEEYKEIADRIYTYIPQTSIIGRLLNCHDKYYVVKSNQKLVWQHDYYSWQIDFCDFVYDDDVDSNSVLMDNIISEWLDTVTLEEREQFVDLVYRLLLTTNVSSFKELDLKGIKGFKQVFKMLENINKNDKKIINKVATSFLKALKQNIFS